MCWTQRDRYSGPPPPIETESVYAKMECMTQVREINRFKYETAKKLTEVICLNWIKLNDKIPVVRLEIKC